MSKNAKIIFYPVDNGNMILLKLEDKTTILVDINVRKKASDNDEEDYYDVMSHLKENLEKDSQDRCFVDSFILSHLDIDHIRGIEENFYLGDIDVYNDSNKEKIIIKEAWCSERFWKRETKSITLSDDAKAYNTAIPKYEKLIEVNYKPAENNFYLGEMWYKRKKYDTAISHFKKSAMLNDKAAYMPTLLLHSAISFENVKDKENAKSFYGTLIELYPNSSEAKEAKTKLSKL